jgi:short-subunit dehydrogenase
MNPAALITGASSGIGEAFAEELAARRHDLVLVARRQDRLDALAARVRDRHGVEAEVLVADLTDDTDRASVARRVTDTSRPVDLVINNAGCGLAGDFGNIPIERHRDQIELNIDALVVLTHAAVEAMVPRGRGGIINVASLGGLAPAPRFATYAATKAFVVSLSEAVHEEVRASGVKVTCVCPGMTLTEFGENAGAGGEDLPGFLQQSAREVVLEALAALDRNQAVRVTGPANRATAAMTHLLPRGAVRRVAGIVADRL